MIRGGFGGRKQRAIADGHGKFAEVLFCRGNGGGSYWVLHLGETERGGGDGERAFRQRRRDHSPIDVKRDR